MKNIISVLLIIALMIGFASCAKTDGEKDKEASSSESTADATEPESTAPESKPDRPPLMYIEPLTDTEKYMIESDWKNAFGEDIVWFDKDAATLDYEATRYYGMVGGYQIIFHHVGWEFDYRCGIELAGKTLAHDELFEIYAYKDGRFYDVVALYDTERLGNIDALMIGYIHEQLETYIKANS